MVVRHSQEEWTKRLKAMDKAISNAEKKKDSVKESTKKKKADGGNTTNENYCTVYVGNDDKGSCKHDMHDGRKDDYRMLMIESKMNMIMMLVVFGIILLLIMTLIIYFSKRE